MDGQWDSSPTPNSELGWRRYPVDDGNRSRPKHGRLPARLPNVSTAARNGPGAIFGAGAGLSLVEAAVNIDEAPDGRRDAQKFVALV